MKHTLTLLFITCTWLAATAQYASADHPIIANKLAPSSPANDGIGLYTSGTFSNCPSVATSGISSCTIDALSEYLAASIEFPEIAMDYDLTASCQVKFTIDKSGRSTDIQVRGCAKSIYERPIIKAVSDLVWTPVTKNGDSISYVVGLNVRFQ